MSAAAAIVEGSAAAIGEGFSTENIDETARSSSNVICRFFVRGACRFGSLCRFSHDLPADQAIDQVKRGPVMTLSAGFVTNTEDQKPGPSTSRSNWANAPVFVPGRLNSVDKSIASAAADENDVAASLLTNIEECAGASSKSWAEVVGGGAASVSFSEPGAVDMVCPFESPCPYGVYCAYNVHLELCNMCDQFCLNPNDNEQRKKHHQECIQQHEQAMELSFAIARSKDKTCGICFDTIIEKAGREKRFGILPNCSHIFCLECIRKWRQAKQFENKIIRSCPECRVCSDFVCPSAFWVETKEEKDKLLTSYRAALGIKDCKYFKKGEGKCPFGNKCFYKHALPNGDLVDVGCPKRARRLHHSSNDIMDLLDIYLWEFVDQRDFHWLELLSGDTSDSDSDDSLW